MNQDAIFSRLAENIKEFVELKVRISVLKGVGFLSRLAANLIATWIVGVICGMSVLFFSIGTAFWLGEQWGSYALGFIAVSVFYITCALIAFFNRKHIEARIGNRVIRKVFKDR